MEMSERGGGGGGGGRTTPTGAECRLELAARSQEQLIFQMLIIGREGPPPPRVWEHGVYPPGNCCRASLIWSSTATRCFFINQQVKPVSTKSAL